MNPDYNNGLFYFKEFGTTGEVGEGCGKSCKIYEPRNGINGRCKFSNNTQSGSGKYFRLTATNKLVPISREEAIQTFIAEG